MSSHETHGRPIRVVLGDDHALVLEGVELLLKQEADIEVVAVCQDADALAEAVRRTRPDVVVADYSLGHTTAPSVVEELAQEGIDVAAVVLSGDTDDTAVRTLMESGVGAVVFKEAAGAELGDAIRAVFAGQEVIPGALRSRWSEVRDTDRARSARLRKLTTREAQVAAAVSAGLSNKRIAREFGVSLSTVKTHLSRIFQKVGVTNRTQLALFMNGDSGGTTPGG